MSPGSMIVLIVIITMVGLAIFTLVKGARFRKGCCGCGGGSCSSCSSRPLTIEDGKE